MTPDFIDSKRCWRVTVTERGSVTGLFFGVFDLFARHRAQKNLYAFDFKFDTTNPTPYLLQNFLTSVTLVL
jgi:hypothetical protein